VGVSFSAYLTRQRMEMARELLRSTNLSSAQVGAAAGYRDARYFSALFHKTQGCTPREYRAQGRKKG
jgi:two-component system response regulator YesN